MTADRWSAVGLIALTVAAVVLVALDVDGPVRAAVSLVFVLLAPGYALASRMGPMSVAARLLVSLAGSAALAMIVSLVLIAAGAWSGQLSLILLAAIAIALVAPASRRRPSAPDRPDPDRPDPASPSAKSPAHPTAKSPAHPTDDLQPETMRRTP